jgi:benzoyl-CoA reductase subunit B
MNEKAIKRLKEEVSWLEIGLDHLKSKPSEIADLNRGVVEALKESHEGILSCVEEGKPFIASIYAYGPEIYTAMGLPWYSYYATRQMATPGQLIQKDVEDCDNLDFPEDVCTAIRMTVYYIEAGLCVIPSAIIAMITPCDGMQIVQQIVATHEDWKDVPMFAPDPPYFDNESAIDYYATEYKEMVSFIEKHTGKKLELERFREVIEESNKQYELWAEYNEYRRMIPSPHGWEMGAQVFSMIQMFVPGDPKGTAWMKLLIENAEKRVKEKRGPVEKEKIRLLWFDIRPLWIYHFASWLEKEWGAVIVMDMFTYNPYTLIDTTSEETMLRGLAKRGLYDVPMVRQERGTTDVITQDITKIVKDYKIDCVVWPSHMGHKAGAGGIGLMREICRDLEVPFLNIGLDLFDSRYTTADEVKDIISKFFTTMGLG